MKDISDICEPFIEPYTGKQHYRLKPGITITDLLELSTPVLKALSTMNFKGNDHSTIRLAYVPRKEAEEAKK